MSQSKIFSHSFFVKLFLQRYKDKANIDYIRSVILMYTLLLAGLAIATNSSIQLFRGEYTQLAGQLTAFFFFLCGLFLLRKGKYVLAANITLYATFNAALAKTYFAISYQDISYFHHSPIGDCLIYFLLTYLFASFLFRNIKQLLLLTINSSICLVFVCFLVYQYLPESHDLITTSSLIEAFLILIVTASGSSIGFNISQNAFKDYEKKTKKITLENEELEQLIKSRTEEISHTNEELRKSNIEIEKAFNELVRTKKETEKALEIKEQFLSIVSHELKTPLNIIKGGVHVLGDSVGKDNESKNILDILAISSNNLNAVIENMLSYNKLNFSDIKPIPTVFSPLQSFKEIISVFTPELNRKEISLITNVDIDPNESFLGDKEMIRQIISNLISNAIKFTSQGQLEINAHLKPTKEGSVLLTSISDTGIGMEKEDIQKIFDLFYRIPKHESLKTQGTGLGLAIVKKLLKLLDGSISIESTVGQGSTFTIEIPLKRVYEEETFGQLSAMIVDEDEISAEFHKRIFQNLNISVESKSTLKESKNSIHNADIYITKDTKQAQIIATETIDKKPLIICLEDLDTEMDNLVFLQSPLQTKEISQTIVEYFKD